MPFRNATMDREFDKFFETSDNETAIRVGIISGPKNKTIEYNAISVSYPNSTTEIFSYFQGGLLGNLVLTVNVVYTDATKDNISTVEFT